MDSSPRRQNSGNHCHKTEYRIKNEKKQSEENLRDLWDNIKCTTNHIIGVLEGKERKDLKKFLKR